MPGKIWNIEGLSEEEKQAKRREALEPFREYFDDFDEKFNVDALPADDFQKRLEQGLQDPSKRDRLLEVLRNHSLLTQSTHRRDKPEDLSKSLPDKFLDQYAGYLDLPTQPVSPIGKAFRTAGRIGAKAAVNILSTPAALEDLGRSLFGTPKELERLFPSKEALTALSPTLLKESSGFLEDAAVAGTEFYALGVGGIGRSLLAGLATEGSEKGAKKLGYGEQGQAIAGLLGFLATAMHKPQGAKAFVEGLMGKAVAEAPPAALPEALSKQLFKDASKGYNSFHASKEGQKLLKKPYQDLKIAKTPEDLIAIRRSLNDLYPELKGGSIKAHGEIVKSIDDTLERFAKSHPEHADWYNNYKRAVETSKIFHQSAKGQQKVEGVLKKLAKPALYYLAHALNLVPGVALGIAGIGGAAKINTIRNRIMKSPELRRYYLDALKGVVTEKPGTTVNALKKMDDELRSERE